MPLATSNSTRISKRFAALRESGELGIVAYITAGDPSLEATHRFVLALAEAGADVIELGIPFSDPLADGPTIQRASERALKLHTTLAQVIDLVREIRKSSEVPLVLFSYYNPVLQMGLEKFASNAATAGADGVLITDLTLEESSDYRRILSAHHLDTIFLGAPTSTDDRLAKIAAVSSGFIYLISRTGVTGAKDALPDDLPALLRRARKVTQLPIAVGFGISLPGHVSVLGGLADAAVVGSALVAEIENATAANPSAVNIEAAAKALATRVRSLKAARPPPASSRRARGGPMNLSDWRRRIDEIDKKLVELLNERSHCALEIGKLKQAANIPLYQPDRENEVLANAERTNPGPLTDAAIRRLFERIIDEARAAERDAMHPDGAKGRGPKEGS